MSRYEASVLLIRTGRVVGSRSFDDPQTAADHLFVLMAAAGFSGDREETVSTLADGDPLSYKGFEYRVTDTARHTQRG